ncbi:MAG: hypothetical protein ACJ0HT_03555, partial [Alphaproteobacteria bacterium]
RIVQIAKNKPTARNNNPNASARIELGINLVSDTSSLDSHKIVNGIKTNTLPGKRIIALMKGKFIYFTYDIKKFYPENQVVNFNGLSKPAFTSLSFCL